MKRIAWLSALALSAGVCTASFGQITGTAKLDGKAPKRVAVAGVAAVPQCAAAHAKEPILDENVVVDENGGLANVVVYLKGVKGDVPKEQAVLNQEGCQYKPHVIAMMVGQELVAKNSDAFLHNVHTMPENSPASNSAQTGKDDKGVALKVQAVETFKVKCDVHPWMNAWIVALDTPYSAVTGEDGTYSIDTKGLANGQYEIVAWQEKMKELPAQKITVTNGKAEANFTFKPKAAAAGNAAPAAAKSAVAAK